MDSGVTLVEMERAMSGMSWPGGKARSRVPRGGSGRHGVRVEE
jgi:hypothetical protein